MPGSGGQTLKEGILILRLCTHLRGVYDRFVGRENRAMRGRNSKQKTKLTLCLEK